MHPRSFLSHPLPCLLVLILSFIVITQSSPDSKYLYELYEPELHRNQIQGSEINFGHSNIRIRRDVENEENQDKVQISSRQSQSIDNSGTTTPPPSQIKSDKTEGSPRGQKIPKVDKVVAFEGFDDINKSNNDTSWEDLVDKLDTVINSTLDEKTKEANQTWKLENDEYKPTDHKYYVATVIKPGQLQPYVDLDELNRTLGIVQEHPMLSRSYRRAATIQLAFKFPFYGHNVKNITIATGGFLYTGDYVHSWLAATQYIAPLMANFDTSSSPYSKIRYADDGKRLVVEWLNVTLQSRDGGLVVPSQTAQSPSGAQETFRFQVILHNNGDIVFAYKEIPVSIVGLNDNEHPVKVGLSDAYIIDRTIFFVRRKTIYEYHRIDKMGVKIEGDTAIWFKAQPTCNKQQNCMDCIDLDFQCQWCPKVNRCSDGMDRKRQDWLLANCDSYNAKTMEECNNIGKDTTNKYRNAQNAGDLGSPGKNGYSRSLGGNSWGTISTNEVGKERMSADGNYHHAAITTISIVALLAISTMVWFVYAYFFPHTWSGQLLIKYRPSRWQWRRGEPRYTAASIHM